MQLAIGSEDKIIRILELNLKLSVTDVKMLYGHQSSVTCLQYSLDNSCLASGSLDYSVIIWN